MNGPYQFSVYRYHGLWTIHVLATLERRWYSFMVRSIGAPFCTTQHSGWLYNSHYYTSRRDNVPPPPISTSLKYCFRNLPSDSTWNSLRALPVFSAPGSRAEQSETRRKRMLSQAIYNYGCFSYFLVIKLIILWSFRHYVGYMTRVQGGKT